MGYIKSSNAHFDGGVSEADTTHCRHCQAVVVRPLRSGGAMIPMQEGGWCSRCDGQLCAHCAKRSYSLGVCEPWKKKVEAQLAANARYDADVRAGLIL